MSQEDTSRGHWLADAAAPDVSVEHSQYKVSDFVGWQRDGSLELRPHYQRGSVWTERDRSFLIDSVVRGYPLPLIVLEEEEYAEAPYTRRRVVDGQQRLRTLIAFVEPGLLDPSEPLDDFSYSPPELGKAANFDFADLPQPIQGRILRTQLPTVLLTAGPNDSSVLEVYDRLNSTGLGLSAQELRYARRDGSFADLSYRLARSNQLRWTDWRLFRQIDVARMKEVEFTSELVLLLLNGVEKTGKLELDAAYENEQWKLAVPNEASVAGDFQGIMDLLDPELTLPPKPDSKRRFRSKGWFYALFAYLLLQSGRLGSDLKPAQGDAPEVPISGLSDELAHVLRIAPGAIDAARATNPDLVRAISGSASDRASREARVRFLASLS